MDIDAIDPSAREGNVARLHEMSAEYHGELPAVISAGGSYTHTELHERSSRFAGGLHELGLREGDRILVYLSNCPEYVTVALGCLKAGTPPSPINPQYKSREIGHQLGDTDAKAVVTEPSLLDRVEETLADTDRDPIVISVGRTTDRERDAVPLSEVDGPATIVEREATDVAIQPYTSGTTGKPKGVLLTHGNLWAQSYLALQGQSPNVTNDDLPPDELRSLVWVPIYHITGFTHGVWQPLIYGGSVVVRDPADWDPKRAMRDIEEYDVTGFTAVAAMYSDIVNSESFGDYDLSSLEAASEGGAKMPAAVQRTFESETGVPINEGYGLTETNGSTHQGIHSSYGIKRGTVGQPYRPIDCKIVDDDGNEVPAGESGEILIRGPVVAAGYHELPGANEEAFTSDGYFRTGDIGRRDEENYFEILDRKKNVIVSAGYNIYPNEVEDLIHEHEAVAEVAVVGVPDTRRNEVPKAFVVLAEDFGDELDATAEEIKAFCIDNLAEYKHPRKVEFVSSLPRTASGKVQRYKLAQEAAEGKSEGTDSI